MLLVRRELKTLLFIGFATGISLFLLLQRDKNLDRRVFSATLPAYPVSTPTLIPSPPVENTLLSPDGKKILSVRKEPVEDKISYSLFSSDGPAAEKKLIFSQTKNNDQNLEIPYNAWSPDDLYFFLKETRGQEENYLIFSASGKKFESGEQYININELFKEKLPQFVLEDVTGWAAPYLLIVNSKTSDGVGRSSFWFDLSTLSFIQLSTHFD